MTFYKLYCLIYRRTDYYELDRIRRRLMYPEYYAEQERKTKDALMKLTLMNSMVRSVYNCDWV